MNSQVLLTSLGQRVVWLWLMAAVMSFGPPRALFAGTVGEVITLRGQISDIALDESRGKLYAANFTANRIEVIGVSSRRLERTIPLTAQPSSLALAPSGEHLLVTHFGNRAGAAFNNNGYTIINLNNGTQQNFGSVATPMAASFGMGGKALIATSNEILLMDPLNGVSQVLMTAQSVAETLPVEGALKPAEIVQATMTTSRDGMMIFGLASLEVNDDGSEGDVSIIFRYDVLRGALRTLSLTAAPPLGPRVISSSRTGAYYMAGWGLLDQKDTLLAQFPNASGQYDIGTHVFDSKRSLIYAQFRPKESEKAQTQSGKPAPIEPVLLVLDDDNLAVRGRYRLPENLAGKSILSGDDETLYSISESGVAIIDIGRLHQAPRISLNRQEILFETSFASKDIVTQEIEITDPSGAGVPFAIQGAIQGITVDPPVGLTPARVRIQVDPQAFRNNRGTSVVPLTIVSGPAVNVLDPVRILVNTRGPDQRGRIINVPGKLVDVVADPVRDRFYVLRQDLNQVLVFDGSSLQQVAVLRTGNTPYSLEITRDNRFLLVGNDNSGIANVFDLETLLPDRHIVFPIGHYPRSLGASNRSIMAASRVAGKFHTIDYVDFTARKAAPYPTLGVYKNDVSIDTRLSTSPSGETIYSAGANGQVLLYEASADEFVVHRKDYDELKGGFGALGDDYYAVGAELLNSSLVRRGTFQTATLLPVGYASADGRGMRVLTESSSTPGLMERFEIGKTNGAKLVRLVEAPSLGALGGPLTRVIAPLANRQSIVMLSTSGLVAVPWNFDEPVPVPEVRAVVNSANYQPTVAPGALISIFGSNLASATKAAEKLPLPGVMADSILQVNGSPIPLLYVSPNQINAQLPFNVSGRVQLFLTTPGGESQPVDVSVLPAAPSVFETGAAGPKTAIPIIIRAKNNQLVTLSNPIHPEDVLVIYATGLGRAIAPVAPGEAAPAFPLPQVQIPAEVSLGGERLDVLYAGLVPGYVGLYQINVSVPWRVPTGMQVPLVIRQGSQESTFSVRVVD